MKTASFSFFVLLLAYLLLYSLDIEPNIRQITTDNRSAPENAPRANAAAPLNIERQVVFSRSVPD